MHRTADALQHFLDHPTAAEDLTVDERDHAALLRDRLYQLVNRTPPPEGDGHEPRDNDFGHAVNSLLKAAEQDGWQIVSLEFRKPRKAVASELRAMADELDPPEGDPA